MEKEFNHLQSGDKVELCINNFTSSKFLVRAKSEDEIIIMSPHSIFASDTVFPSNQVIIGNVTSLNGYKIKNGDNVQLVTKNGKKISMYVSYTIGKDGLVLSLKKKATHSVLKWLLKLMS